MILDSAILVALNHLKRYSYMYIMTEGHVIMMQTCLLLMMAGVRQRLLHHAGHLLQRDVEGPAVAHQHGLLAS
jgi:hypothetical protein